MKELPKHLQDIVDKANKLGITFGSKGYEIEDVTPEGYGPSEN